MYVYFLGVCVCLCFFLQCMSVYSSVARVLYNIYLRYTTSGTRTSTAVLLLLLLLVFRSPMQDGTTLK